MNSSSIRSVPAEMSEYAVRMRDPGLDHRAGHIGNFDRAGFEGVEALFHLRYTTRLPWPAQLCNQKNAQPSKPL
jgi:hypothetical protein